MSVGSFSSDDGDGNENVAAVTFVDAKSSQFQPLCRLCVEHVKEVARESARFVDDEGPEQIFVDITEEVEASSER